jgi:hypothetical protein
MGLYQSTWMFLLPVRERAGEGFDDLVFIGNVQVHMAKDTMDWLEDNIIEVMK